MSFNIKGPDFRPKDFIVANYEDVKQLQERVDKLEKAIEGLYDLIEELAKKI